MSRLRLENDQRRLRALAAKVPGLLTIEREIGTPTTEYHLVLRCKGLAAIPNGVPDFASVHRVVVRLGADYPISEPGVDFLTPIFHPHVWPHDRHLCLGGWRTTEYLDLLVCRLFSIIQMQREFINTNSPANPVALQWTLRNQKLLPLGNDDPCTSPPQRPKFTFTPIP